MKIRCARCGNIIEIGENVQTVVCPKCKARLSINRNRTQKKPAPKKTNKRSFLVPLVFVCIVFCVVMYFVLFTGNEEIKNAEKLLEEGKYDEAYSILSEIGEEKLIKDSKYDRGMEFIKNGDYLNGYSLLKEVGNYKGADKYISDDIDGRVAKCFEENRLEEGMSLLYELKDDADNQKKLIEREKELIKNALVGDEVIFGKFEQDGKKNVTEWIRWTVVEKSEGEVLLLAKSGLCSMPFTDYENALSWEKSSIRNYLNGVFTETAFTDAEKELLVTVKNQNPASAVYGTSGTGETDDKVFLLSSGEAKKLGAETLKCAPTAVALKEGAWKNKDGFSFWWLRDPGRSKEFFADVKSDGKVYSDGTRFSTSSSLVRPAIKIKF